MSPWLHRLFELTVECNAPLPFAPYSTSRLVDMVVTLGRGPSSAATRFTSWFRTLESNGWLEGDFQQIAFEDGSRFGVDTSGKRVWGWWPETLSYEDGLPYLAGPVLGAALRLRGFQTLHASAVAVDGRGIAILGAAGMGKSTTAAALANISLPILTDDIAALRREDSAFVVIPSYPRLNLWPESAKALFGETTLPAICPENVSWNKRFITLGLGEFRFAEQAVPLSRVYVLGERGATPQVRERLTTRDGLATLFANLQGVRLLDTLQRRRTFDDLTHLVNSVPIFRVCAPSALHDMPLFADCLVRHAQDRNVV